MQNERSLYVKGEYMYRNYKSYNDLGMNVTKLKVPQKVKPSLLTYESPFVQQARLQARQRTKGKTKTKKMSSGWNDTFAKETIEYFDPTLQKDRLFKLNPRQPHTHRRDENSTEQAADKTNSPTTENASRLTKRTTKV
jgi:hypothetical protein